LGVSVHNNCIHRFLGDHTDLYRHNCNRVLAWCFPLQKNRTTTKDIVTLFDKLFDKLLFM
jgi:hypothetical protein